ncbi:Asp23/Gls24 family envelope stress response protein [Xylanimonas sp. McL0601]|uniref:Asp23/Gls24 family envelope stress response protein n=1 Tax=Xylanimonas sp. McL0601 TaxID=3414739 RepID=UPI003CE7E641
MTATTSPQQPLAAPEPATTAPEDRGRLTIGDRVVERVAGYAVTLVPHAVAAPRRILGVAVGRARPDDEAHVQATVHGTVAWIEVAVAVEWPHPVDRVAQAARRQVQRDVEHITGIRVDRVDVEVTSLAVPSTARRVR